MSLSSYEISLVVKKSCFLVRLRQACKATETSKVLELYGCKLDVQADMKHCCHIDVHVNQVSQDMGQMARTVQILKLLIGL